MIVNIIEAVLLSCFISSLLTTKKNKITYIALLAIVSFVTIQISNMINDYDILLTSATIFAIVIVSIPFVIDDISKIMFVACLEAVFYSFVGYLGLLICSLFTNFNIIFVSKLLYAILMILLLNFFKKNILELNKTIYYILSIILFAIQLESSLLLQVYFVLENQLPEIILAAIIFIFSNSLFLYLIFNLSSLYKVKFDYEILKIEKNNTTIIEQLYDELKIAKHDLKHQYMMFKDYLENDKNTDLLNHINSNIEYLNDLATLVNSKNSLLNTIINNKIIEAHIRNINITSHIIVSETLPISNYDIYNFLGNLLDNAIENSNDYIHLKIVQDEFFLHIIIENSYPGDFKNYTSKDPKSHGFGLKSIIKICNKYNAHYEINHKNQTYTFKSSFPLK